MKTLIKLTLASIIMFSTYGIAATPGEPQKNNGIKKWFNKHLSYPQDAVKKAEEGTVYVYFELVNGSATNISIIQSVSPSLDKAALKAVEEMPASEWAEFAPYKDNKYILPFKFEIK